MKITRKMVEKVVESAMNRAHIEFVNKASAIQDKMQDEFIDNLLLAEKGPYALLREQFMTYARSASSAHCSIQAVHTQPEFQKIIKGIGLEMRTSGYYCTRHIQDHYKDMHELLQMADERERLKRIIKESLIVWEGPFEHPELLMLDELDGEVRQAHRNVLSNVRGMTPKVALTYIESLGYDTAHLYEAKPCTSMMIPVDKSKLFMGTKEADTDEVRDQA